eukprot:TRINITY_DN4255_c0_g3_i1.p1 TRINITY_DN4255_c0_g3~~TRINITY_DN4255_c0_g3_i1.p1  ORF type:complete len:563 (-),score=150.94 TRINITY_DN4255_c0_g3_i1:612-2300(-)
MDPSAVAHNPWWCRCRHLPPISELNQVSATSYRPAPAKAAMPRRSAAAAGAVIGAALMLLAAVTSVVQPLFVARQVAGAALSAPSRSAAGQAHLVALAATIQRGRGARGPAGPGGLQGLLPDEALSNATRMKSQKTVFREKSIPDDCPYPVNNDIKAIEVRITSEQTAQDGEIEECNEVMRTKDALQLAKSKGLSLVCINEDADPPICYIVDVGKLMFDLKKKEKAKSKLGKAPKLKDVRMSYTIGENDLKTHLRRMEKWMAVEKMQVRVTMVMKGRSKMFEKQAMEIMERVRREMAPIARAFESAKALKGSKVVGKDKRGDLICTFGSGADKALMKVMKEEGEALDEEAAEQLERVQSMLEDKANPEPWMTSPEVLGIARRVQELSEELEEAEGTEDEDRLQQAVDDAEKELKKTVLKAQKAYKKEQQKAGGGKSDSGGSAEADDDQPPELKELLAEIAEMKEELIDCGIPPGEITQQEEMKELNTRLRKLKKELGVACLGGSSTMGAMVVGSSQKPMLRTSSRFIAGFRPSPLLSSTLTLGASSLVVTAVYLMGKQRRRI